MYWQGKYLSYTRTTCWVVFGVRRYYTIVKKTSDRGEYYGEKRDERRGD